MVPRLDAFGQPTVFGPIAYGPAAGEVYLYAVSSNADGLDSRLFMSIDDGGSWTHRYGPQVTGGAIAATQTTPSTIYVGGAARTPGEPQLYASSDGATWTPVATFASPLSANGETVVNEITALVVDPADPQRIWAGFRYPDYIMYSGDGGVHWEARSLGLGAGPDHVDRARSGQRRDAAGHAGRRRHLPHRQQRRPMDRDGRRSAR